MNQSFTQAVPFDDAGTEWADCNHFDGRRLAALRYTFNRTTGLYEWTETGPLVDSDHPLTEASVCPYGSDWIIAARTSQAVGGVAWSRTADPFTTVPEPCFPGTINSNAPVTAYTCPDGALRLFGGDVDASPYGNGRDPLYCWDVDPDNGYTTSHRREVFDTVKADLPIDHRPTVDMCKLLPHTGGPSQYIAHRVRPKSTRDPVYTGQAVSEAEIDCAGIYYARVEYDDAYPSPWTFE